jgi:hypothetical protein
MARSGKFSLVANQIPLLVAAALAATAALSQTTPRGTRTVTLPSGSGSGNPSSTGGAAFTCPAAPSPDAYWGGVFCWPIDRSVNATINYHDTSGVPFAGRYDVAAQMNAYGLWQPALDPLGTCVRYRCLNTTSYTHFAFSFKPTVANQNLLVGWMAANDTQDGVAVADATLATYCTGALVDVWNSCTVPLSAFRFSPKLPVILKFWIQEHNGNAATIYFANAALIQ